MELRPIIKIKDPSLLFTDKGGVKYVKYSEISEIVPATKLDCYFEGEYMIIFAKDHYISLPATLKDISFAKQHFKDTFNKDFNTLKEFQERKKNYEILFEIGE